MKCRIMRHFIWVFTVCLSDRFEGLVFKELKKDVQIEYLDDAVEEGSLTKSDYGNYYEG